MQFATTTIAKIGLGSMLLISTMAVQAQSFLLNPRPCLLRFDDCDIVDPISVSLSGSTRVKVNETRTYSVNVSSGHHTSTTYDPPIKGTIVSQSKTSVTVRWTSTGTGRISATAYVNGNFYPASRSVTISQPPPPPARPSSLSVSLNTCGNRTVTRSNPPSGVTWYWQTSSSGTQRTDASKTKTLSATRTLYLRAYNHSTRLWSSTRTQNVIVHPLGIIAPTTTLIGNSPITLTASSGCNQHVTWYLNNFPIAFSQNSLEVYQPGTYQLRSGSSTASVVITADPPATPSPLSVSSNTCGNKTVTRDDPPSGVTWYWQTSSSGTQRTDVAKTKTLNATQTLYLRAYNHSTLLWSSTRTQTVTVTPPAVSINAPTTTLVDSTPITLTASGTCVETFQWYRYNQQVGTGNTLVVYQPGIYEVRSGSATASERILGNRTFYSTSNGQWDDPIWSLTQNGNAQTAYPGLGDVAYIQGQTITVSNSQQCKTIHVLGDQTPTRLSVSGDLTVDDKVIIERNGHTTTTEVVVAQGANLKIQATHNP